MFEHCTMKARWRVTMLLRLCYFVGLDEDTRPDRFTGEEKSHPTGGWVSSRNGLDVVKKVLLPAGNVTPYCPARNKSLCLDNKQ
jgi:hypothetical protein